MANLAWAPRPRSFDTKYGHSSIQLAVLELLRSVQYSRSGMFTTEIAKRIGSTWNEARLALSYWSVEKYIGYRNDGRWYYDSNEPWRPR